MTYSHLPCEWLEVKWLNLTTADGFRRGPFGGNLKKSFFVPEGYAVYEQYAPINDDCTNFRYFVDEKKYNEMSSFWVNGGDFLISCSGTMGRITQVPDRAPSGVINQALLRIRFSNVAMHPRYFLRLFRSPQFQERILSKSGGGAIQNLAAVKQLKEILVPLPPLAEQKAIAQKLDTLLAQVETTKARLDRIPDILKRFRQSVLAAAVSGKLTEEWRSKNNHEDWIEGILADFIEKPTYGSSAKSETHGNIPVLRMGNIQGGELDWANLVFSSDPVEIEKYKLKPSDVLFNRTNSPELVGKTALYRGEREAIYAGYLIKITCRDSLNAEFLNYHLNSPLAKDYCRSVKSDGVSQSNINAKKIANYRFICPSINEQIQIVNKVKTFFAHADTIERQVQAAQVRVNSLTQSILAKAFRGDLTADWRAANPELISGENSAESLLLKIKAEREAMKPKRKTKKKA